LKLTGSHRVKQRKGPPEGPGEPLCPDWLCAEARAKWDEIVPPLLEAGVVCGLDQAILTAYCQAWAELVEATRLLAEQGRTTTCGTGGLKPHPAVALQRGAVNMLRLLGAQLGLTPEGRLRLHLDQGAFQEERDELEEFLSG
jgi:P27 family predicted phage terminase small subunit